MKIIKEGIAPANHEVQGVCFRCGCMVQWRKGESVREDHGRDGSFWAIKCPTPKCGGEIFGYDKDGGMK